MPNNLVIACLDVYPREILKHMHKDVHCNIFLNNEKLEKNIIQTGIKNN